MLRDSKRTRKKILKAVERILARSGFRKVAITAVAREAGVDKVLIYRYFGGLPELLRAYAEEGHFWPSADELLAAARSHNPKTQADWAVYLLIEFGRILRSRPITLEIMRWEILEKNELTVAFSEYRERETARLLQFFRGRKLDDLPAMTSLLGASMTHLLLRSKAIDTYNGLHLRDDKDWKRIERGVETLVRAAFANASRVGPSARSTVRGAGLKSGFLLKPGRLKKRLL